MALKSWSTTAASNATVGSINFAENQAANTVNDSARSLMADVRTDYENREWRDWGHTVTYASTSTFTIATDVTAIYTANRPIRCTDATTLYGKVSSSSYGAPNTTVTVTLDSGSLSASLTAVALGFDTTGDPIDVSGVRGAVATTGAQTIETISLTGGQIAFPATQNASSNANTLDDYEEGTWTPVLTFTTPGNLSVTYSAQAGTYTKIGNVILAHFRITTSAFTHTTASGDLRITGLGMSVGSGYGSGSIHFSGITKANYTNFTVIPSAGPYFYVYASGSGQAQSLVGAADMPTGGSVVLNGTAIFSL